MLYSKLEYYDILCYIESICDIRCVESLEIFTCPENYNIVLYVYSDKYGESNSPDMIFNTSDKNYIVRFRRYPKDCVTPEERDAFRNECRWLDSDKQFFTGDEVRYALAIWSTVKYPMISYNTMDYETCYLVEEVCKNRKDVMPVHVIVGYIRDIKYYSIFLYDFSENILKDMTFQNIIFTRKAHEPEEEQTKDTYTRSEIAVSLLKHAYVRQAPPISSLNPLSYIKRYEGYRETYDKRFRYCPASECDYNRATIYRIGADIGLGNNLTWGTAYIGEDYLEHNKKEYTFTVDTLTELSVTLKELREGIAFCSRYDVIVRDCPSENATVDTLTDLPASYADYTVVDTKFERRYDLVKEQLACVITLVKESK